MVLNNLYETINQMDQQTRFQYLVIFTLVVSIFMRMHFGLNIVMACGVSYLIIKYLEEKKRKGVEAEMEQHHEKVSYLKPKPKYLHEHQDLTKLVFSIQELYDYNPSAFIEMVNNIDQMMKLYREMPHITRRCSMRYQIAESKMRNALNALHSIVFVLKEPARIKKLSRAHKKLNILLQRYLKKIHQYCEDLVAKNGVDIETSHEQFDAPKAHNSFLKTPGHTYEYY